VIDAALCEQLVRVAGIRNRTVHDYVVLFGGDVHEAKSPTRGRAAAPRRRPPALA
jgi:hypothetical protein